MAVQINRQSSYDRNIQIILFSVNSFSILIFTIKIITLQLNENIKKWNIKSN